MILLDFNQAMITSITGKWSKAQKPTDEFLRTMFTERIRATNKNYRHMYGDMIICCDGGDMWRKDYFSFYKFSRKAERDVSTLDWNKIHHMLDTFKSELDEFFPYKVIKVKGAEADDVIARLVMSKEDDEKVLIYSGDGDFAQLQRYPNVDQYSPIIKKFIKVDDPERMLKEKIIRGDPGDGIPNILSKDNIFLLEDERQNAIKTVNIKKWLEQEPDEFCTTQDMKKNWERNKNLIDFNFIPQEILNRIDTENLKIKEVRKDKLIQYFMHHGASQFIPLLQDF